MFFSKILEITVSQLLLNFVNMGQKFVILKNVLNTGENIIHTCLSSIWAIFKIFCEIFFSLNFLKCKKKIFFSLFHVCDYYYYYYYYYYFLSRELFLALRDKQSLNHTWTKIILNIIISRLQPYLSALCTLPTPRNSYSFRN